MTVLQIWGQIHIRGGNVPLKNPNIYGCLESVMDSIHLSILEKSISKDILYRSRCPITNLVLLHYERIYREKILTSNLVILCRVIR